MIRPANRADLAAVLRLYAQLNPDDPPLDPATAAATFDGILAASTCDLYVLELDGRVVATAYLNLIPNLSRSARPYAVVENVVVDAALRGTGLGKQLMAAVLRAAWDAGCYKAMLATSSRNPATHAFYRACGFSGDAKTAYLARPPRSLSGDGWAGA
ncbi:GNAT family N-acetyltransferase [Actinoplanes sp. RD1]|uniref:GNAT family N-acetyltransferase n=1 Tax=Actinoplanes sp. RD1 TaxID=3064538 RepID=UPI0027410ADE|nr:GNAT family N-acetyltransferase [Actinoplanes sp. RD1]